AKRLGIDCHTDNRKLVGSSEIVILCVKPHQAQHVLSEIADCLTKKHLLISVCASITTQQLSEWSGGNAAIVRSMPNTPCLIREGMTVLCPGPRAQKSHLEASEKIFGTLGRTAVVEEPL